MEEEEEDEISYSKNLSLESQDELYQDKLMQISTLTDNLVWNAV